MAVAEAEIQIDAPPVLLAAARFRFEDTKVYYG